MPSRLINEDLLELMEGMSATNETETLSVDPASSLPVENQWV